MGKQSDPLDLLLAQDEGCLQLLVEAVDSGEIVVAKGI
jgi:hypothetical protein